MRQGQRSAPASNMSLRTRKTAMACICTIGIARAQAKLTLVNLAYNFNRLIFHKRRAATG
jgi:hypothetical protein